MWTTKIGGPRIIVLTALAILILAGSANAQKSQADGVVVFTQKDAEQGGVTAGDAPGFPVTISESGSYRLGSNLILPDGDTTGIEITTQLVTVDLSGFSIIGPGSPGTGVGIRSQGVGASVLNGTVTGVGSTGVVVVTGCRIEGVRSQGNRGGGIQAARGCIVANNNVNANGGIGISGGTTGMTVIGNIVNANVQLGMALPADAGYAQNVVTQNNGGNTQVQVSGGIQMGPNVCGNALCP